MPQYNRKDHFYHKAKKEGYPARSAYKLLEMDKQFGILKPGTKIVDLGCAPGGWLKVIEGKMKQEAGSRKQGSKEKIEPRNLGTQEPRHLDTWALGHIIIAIDLLPLQYTPSPTTHFIQGDFTNPQNQLKIKQLLDGAADWVLSDMSPNLSGIKFKDNQGSLELCEQAFSFAKSCLKKGGGLVVKIFPGSEFEKFTKELKKSFKSVGFYEPEATRNSSREIYILSMGFVPIGTSYL